MARFERQVNMLMFYIWLALIIETQVRFGCAWAFFVQAYTCLEFFLRCFMPEVQTDFYVFVYGRRRK